MDNKINPIYLTHYLNSSMVKKQLFKDITISSIPMTKVKDIENLLIDIPSLKIQEILANTQKLAIQEMRLLENLIKEKKQLYRSIFETIVKETI